MNATLTVLGCCAGSPADGTAASGYLLESGTTHTLIDCGPGVMLELTRYWSPSVLDAVIISHRHADHCADLVALAYARCFPQVLPPLPLFGPPDLEHVLRGLDTLFAIPSLPELTQPLSQAFHFHPVEPGSSFIAAEQPIDTLPAHHPVPTLALRWPRLGLVYTADGALTAALVAFARNAQVLLAEATYVEANGHDLQGHGHLSAEQTGVLAAQAQVETLVATHFAECTTAAHTIAMIQRRYQGAVLAAHRRLQVRM